MPAHPNSGRRGKRRPLDRQALDRLALRYAARYATTRARLRAYLKRKVDERGWSGDANPDIDALVERMATLGYVDDAAFAAARTASLQRRGYGERRIAQALTAAGIAPGDRTDCATDAFAAALRFVQRRKLGPYALEKADRAAREKAFAAMLRAGHPISVVRALLDAEPGDVPNLG